MNVAYILHSTEPTDGATKAFLTMMDGLRAYGVKPFVVVPDKGELFFELSKKQIPTLVVNYRPSAYPYCHTVKQRLLFLTRLAARIFVNHKATKAIRQFLLDNKIDIVHSNSGIIRIGFDAAQKAGIPHICHIREYADKIGIRYFPSQASFVRQLSQPRSYSICITKAIQQHYRQNGRDDVSRVIYDGVLSEIAVMPMADTKEYFLFAGRIQPAKGLDQLLTAFKRYVESTDKPLHLKVAGGSADKAYYNRMAKYVAENALGDKVEFLGSRNDVAALMREARALIVSSPFEGFGFCMPEAQQQGCLVIGRNTSGTKEQMDNALEMTGQEIALRYDTTEELTKLLQEVASCPISDYAGYTRKAFEVVNQLYTKEKHVQEVWNFYQDISR